MNVNLKIDKFNLDLSDLGFKKRWLSDKSGFWMEKQFKYKGDMKLKLIVEAARKIFTLGIITGEYCSGSVKMNKHYDDLCKYKCDIKTVKEVLKKYK